MLSMQYLSMDLSEAQAGRVVVGLGEGEIGGHWAPGVHFQGREIRSPREQKYAYG